MLALFYQIYQVINITELLSTVSLNFILASQFCEIMCMHGQCYPKPAHNWFQFGIYYY